MSRQRCVDWRTTESCDGNGIAESSREECDKTINGNKKGYCSCFGGSVKMQADCDHQEFTCDEICRSGRYHTESINS